VASNQFQAVLFDLDGTLIDGYPAIAASVNALLADHQQPPLSIEQVKPYVGRGLEVLLQALISDFDSTRDVAAYRRYYDRLMYEGTHLFPGAMELLNSLAKFGTKLGICSNKLAAFSAKLLQHLGIADRFSAVLGPEHVAQPKPAPDMLLLAANRLSVSPADTLYIGDMSVDAEAGRKAGMTVWLVTTGSEHEETLAQVPVYRVFSNLSEVRTVLFGGDA